MPGVLSRLAATPIARRVIRHMTTFVRPGTSAALKLRGGGAAQCPKPPPSSGSTPGSVQRPCYGRDASPEKCANCHVFPCNKIMMQRFQGRDYSFRANRGRPWLWFFATAGIYVVLNTEQVPITDRYRVRLVPEFLERRMDEDYDQTIVNALTTRALPVESMEHQRIQSIGDQLCKANGLPPMEYFVIDDDEENAFVSAGGKVIFYTGLLRVLDSVDEVAVVLSHELGHYVARHSSERTGIDWLKACLQAIFDLDGSDTANKVSTMALTLPKSRSVEREADHIGLILLARACFNLNAAPKAWEKLHASKLRHLEERQREFEETQEHRTEMQAAQRLMDTSTRSSSSRRYARGSGARHGGGDGDDGDAQEVQQRWNTGSEHSARHSEQARESDNAQQQQQQQRGHYYDQHGRVSGSSSRSSGGAQSSDGLVGNVRAVVSSVLTSSANAFLEDSIEPETFAERLWATHPTHTERLDHFRLDGPWMEAARGEQERYCNCCEALRPVPAFHETRPLRWWLRATKDRVAREHMLLMQQEGGDGFDGDGDGDGDGRRR
ncbi:hypothetical protein PTSG_06619 [Salpingoeca rosetta]|uniref:Peptidase M48 domain-containing protein n=1 Tax=Salpingoeca rosetta (strain ATCC 50818 / BSB-021) TaxID=946362 RepID=F2UFI1_SALR5|nr:uncharacterized protein PTSG_06619 [Salpingoeca rosetta]EGD75549.1 hypothetical protein PTSG_06619 [Salpingoeca rosetta]|eukprot:XP_004992006.1 hypothetical protein PTSG_06619 [Salpingoeca rosetta]